ncbi:hypothetical protein HYV50_01125 [Candidatus Pacearchaeota archaeon]|nr:hypothetical protein [Candidatus Pacearchaeota archaeon]
MKNKKAQLGKIIATFPVLILIVIIMAIFIILSMFIAALHKPESQKAFLSLQPQENNLMLKEINIKFPDNSDKQMLVLEAFILYKNDEIKKDALDKSLQELIQEKNYCIILTSENVNDAFLIKLNADGTFYSNNAKSSGSAFATNIPIEVPRYKDASLLSKISIKNKKNEMNEIRHYYGKCST